MASTLRDAVTPASATDLFSTEILTSILPRSSTWPTVFLTSSSFSRKVYGILTVKSSCLELSDLISAVIFFEAVSAEALPKPVIDISMGKYDIQAIPNAKDT